MKIVNVMLLVMVLIISGCTQASVASNNISVLADDFRINRRIVFYNSWLGEYMLVIEGRCSLEVDDYDSQLELTCKIGDNEYNKHYLGLSGQVTYFAEQIEVADVDTYHYNVIFRPSTIIPDIDYDAKVDEEYE